MREITTLDELKSIELEIMKKIHAFCVENDLTYFLAYGTLIGAVRHKGFIPWDDDIDIWMPRPDYEKFMEIFPAYGEKNKLRIMNHTTQPAYYRPFSKVVDTRTRLEEKAFRDDPIGVFVDIWPLDGIPEDEKKQKKLFNKTVSQKNLIYAVAANPKWKEYPFKKRFAAWLLGKFINVKKAINKQVKLCKTYAFDDCENVGFLGGKNRIFQKEWLKPELTPFEDAEFYIPKDYDKILRSMKGYGDYMTPPPPEKRIPHHPANVWWVDDPE